MFSLFLLDYYFGEEIPAIVIGVYLESNWSFLPFAFWDETLSA